MLPVFLLFLLFFLGLEETRTEGLNGTRGESVAFVVYYFEKSYYRSRPAKDVYFANEQQ